MKICEFSKRNKPGKNIDMSWAELVDRLNRPTITSETADEYSKMSKAEQSEVKDVGGFVGGLVKEGKRSKETVEYRELICLDMDFAETDYAERIGEFLQPYEYAVYPTHKFRKDKPRVRLVLPVSRPMKPEEYEPVSRLIASKIGIDYFDDTTYQYERLMYYPSVSKDIPYEPIFSHGQFFDPDLALSLYDDWHDVSQWPVSKRQGRVVQSLTAKQADPLEKKGVVGAFCRTYSIEEAIRVFLSDVYEPNGANRYTYKGGSTFGGLVVYDDKFAYSHHSTDPACGMLCNSFDLVRCHKFDLTEDNEDAPTGKRKSFIEMENFALEDPKVKQRLISERQRTAEDDFAEDLAGGNWLTKLKVDKKGVPLSITANVVLILENDPRFKNQLGGNDLMKGLPVKFGRMPWEEGPVDNRFWNDSDDANLRCLLENEYGISSPKKIDDAVAIVQARHAFHPIRDYLNSLEWDGQKRVEDFFINYMGVEEGEYPRLVARKFFTAAVARVMEPGCKWDYMPMLIGAQGLGKSRLISALFGPKYTNDTLTSLNGKGAYEALSGTWAVEMAELSLFRKSDIESLKQYITSPSDKYRKAYGRRVEEVPRQCVFIGTTNEDDCLKDYTGNRRFWPLQCSESIDRYFQIENRDQIWAEAVELYNAGEKMYLTPEEDALVQEMQIPHTFIPDRWVSISNYLDRKLPTDWYDMSVTDRVIWLKTHELDDGEVRREVVCSKEIWAECFRKNDSEYGNADQRDINAALKYLGWERAGRLVAIAGYGRQRAYSRKVGGDVSEETDQ